MLKEAAAQILEREGLAGFNTNAVARRAGVSIGSLYQYFPNKQALLAALIADEQTSHRETLARAVDEALALPLEPGLGHLLDTAMDRQTRRPVLSRTLDFAERDLPVGGLLADTARAQRSELVRYLNAHAEELHLADPDEAAGDVLTIARALIDAAESDGSADRDPDRLRARVLRAVVGYLRR